MLVDKERQDSTEPDGEPSEREGPRMRKKSTFSTDRASPVLVLPLPAVTWDPLSKLFTSLPLTTRGRPVFSISPSQRFHQPRDAGTLGLQEPGAL